MFKKIIFLILFLIVGCMKTTHIKNDCFIITYVFNNEYGYTAEYHFKIYVHGYISKETNQYYFIDTIGAYEVGDTIFKSTLNDRLKK